EAWQRGDAQFGIWGAEGSTLDFAIVLKPVGRSAIKPAPVQITSPSGKVSELPAAQGTEPNRYTFAATESGLYRIQCHAGSHTATIQSKSRYASLVAPLGGFHFVWRAGPLYFLVPEGV